MQQADEILLPLRRRILLTLLVSVTVWMCSPQALAECPFANSRGPIVVGFSLNSWNEYWDLFQAKNLGTIVFETVADDLIPAALKLAEATGEITNLPNTLHEFADAMDWTLLQDSAIRGMVYHTERTCPGLGAVVYLTPPDNKSGTLYKNLSDLFETIAQHSQAALSWNPGEQESWLGLASIGSSTATAAPGGTGILFLHQTATSVILTTDPLFSPDEPSHVANSRIEDLWKRLPEPVVSTVMVDLGELADLVQNHLKLVNSLAGGESSKTASSLVLDKTTEALFDKDPGTLEKLRKVEKDFNMLAPAGYSDEIVRSIEEILDLIRDQGILLSAVGPTSGGILETTLWSVDASNANGTLFEVSPLSSRMLSLLKPDIVEVSIQGLPDFQTIYSRILNLVQKFPGGTDVLKEWDALQETCGFSVEKDLLSAVGREMGWVSRKKEKSGFSGFTVASNDLFYVLDLKDTTAAKRTLAKAGELLAQYGFPATATSVADVTFSVLNTGILGKAMWGILKDDPSLLIVTTSSSTRSLEELIQSIRSPQSQGLTQHPQWARFQTIWSDHPTAVALSDLTTTWKQTIDQMRSSQMMMALMGSSSAMSLPFFRMGIRVMQAMQPPEWGFTVDSVEPGLRTSRTLLLYPPVEKDSTQP